MVVRSNLCSRGWFIVHYTDSEHTTNAPGLYDHVYVSSNLLYLAFGVLTWRTLKLMLGTRFQDNLKKVEKAENICVMIIIIVPIKSIPDHLTVFGTNPPVAPQLGISRARARACQSTRVNSQYASPGWATGGPEVG